MIFVTVGSQKFQMDRLIKAVDQLGQNMSDDEIVAQIGYSTYVPQNIRFKRFFDRDEFKDIMSRSNTVITHGGTGAIVGALKLGKRVIAVPRDQKFGEHVDNHQYQIVDLYAKKNLIVEVTDLSELPQALKTIDSRNFDKFVSTRTQMLDDIRKTIFGWN